MPKRMLDKVIAMQGKTNWRKRDKRVLFLFVAAVIWALFAQVDRVVTAPGKVIPYDKVKVIQHLEGGIIEQLFVREDQYVKEGEPLITLDLASGGSNLSEMEARLGALNLSKLRLIAESRGGDFLVPEDLDAKLQQSGVAEFNTFNTRKEELVGTIATLNGQRSQAEKRVSELRAQLNASEQGLDIALKQLAISEKLVADKLVSELEHFERMRAVERARGDIASTKEAIKGAQAQVEESVGRAQEENARFRRRASDELGDVERRIASLNEEVAKARDQASRAVIRAPIDGFVKNIKYQALGNVVKPGEPIMEVVPEKDRLVIELKLSPVDRGYVIEEQAALVKISAFDYYRYGGLDGKVASIAADTTIGPQEEQFYRVIVETDKGFIGEETAGMKITPGMTGEVAIKVDSQSVLWALLRPILKIKHEALRET
jgi:membrane fusion protein, adhesin transport system